MARSQLLKDIVTGQGSIENILLRLKVILSDLEYVPIMNWINGEFQGYKNLEDIPKYRTLQGSPKGTYIINNNVQYSNATVPLMHVLKAEDIETLTTLKIDSSIISIQNILNGENRENLSKVIPTEYCHSISTYQLQITGMHISYSSIALDEIVSNVKSILVEIVMELEKQFENLDELDIKEQVEKSLDKKQNVIYNIEKIICEGSIDIGDGNRFKKSKLGRFLGDKE